jgi:hypothetical protein
MVIGYPLGKKHRVFAIKNDQDLSVNIELIHN